MTWSRIEPYSAGASRAHPVTVSTSVAAGKAMRPFMTITVRRDLLPGLAVLARGSHCQVLAGAAENAGQLRLHAGADYLCKAPTGGHTKSDTISIRAPLPAGVEPGKRRPTAVEHDYQASWLVLTLPWAPPAPAAPAPARAPHQSITERVADPAAAHRGARR